MNFAENKRIWFERRVGRVIHMIALVGVFVWAGLGACQFEGLCALVPLSLAAHLFIIVNFARIGYRRTGSPAIRNVRDSWRMGVIGCIVSGGLAAHLAWQAGDDPLIKSAIWIVLLACGVHFVAYSWFRVTAWQQRVHPA